jgi:hypothetical protein
MVKHLDLKRVLIPYAVPIVPIAVLLSRSGRGRGLTRQWSLRHEAGCAHQKCNNTDVQLHCFIYPVKKPNRQVVAAGDTSKNNSNFSVSYRKSGFYNGCNPKCYQIQSRMKTLSF